MTKIDNSHYLSNQPKNRTPSPELGKDEFLKILMTQLQHQDPLDPMDDKDFIAQMATFSQLEQTMNMASSMESLVQNQLVSPVIQYSHMIGKDVTYEHENDDKTKETITSRVESVSQKDGYAILELANGEKIYADSIIKAADASDEDSTETEDETDA